MTSRPTFTSLAPKAPPPAPVQHWCEHADCRAHGSFGFTASGRTVWFCFAHRAEGEAVLLEKASV